VFTVVLPFGLTTAFNAFTNIKQYGHTVKVGIAPKTDAPPKMLPLKTTLETYFGTKITFTESY